MVRYVFRQAQDTLRQAPYKPPHKWNVPPEACPELVKAGIEGQRGENGLLQNLHLIYPIT